MAIVGHKNPPLPIIKAGGRDPIIKAGHVTVQRSISDLCRWPARTPASCPRILKICGRQRHGNVTSRKMEAAIENLSGGIVRTLLTRTMHLESSKNIKNSERTNIFSEGMLWGKIRFRCSESTRPNGNPVGSSAGILGASFGSWLPH